MNLKKKVFFRPDEQAIVLILMVIFLIACGVGIAKRENLKEVKVEGRIEINTADTLTLEALPYVGPKLGAKIIESRQKDGPFSSFEDFDRRIKGIGRKRLEKWKGLVTFAGSDEVFRKREGESKGDNDRRGLLWGSDEVQREREGERNASSERKPLKKKVLTKKQEKININTATKEELETLPRIGPKLAERIIDYRREHGNFKSIEEIIKVKGIGEKTFERLASLITVEEVKK